MEDLSVLQLSNRQVDHLGKSGGHSGKVEKSLATDVAAGQSGSAGPVQNGAEIDSVKEIKSLKIKGFHIGMDINDVPNIVRGILPNWAVVGAVQIAKDVAVIVIPDAEGEPFSMELEPGQKFVLINGSGNTDNGAGSIGDRFLLNMPLTWAAFVGDEDGRVFKFVWGGPVVKSLFRAEKMELSDFVQKFVDAYKIPQMRVSDDFRCWRYISKEGVGITIKDNWLICVEEVLSAAESEQAFD